MGCRVPGGNYMRMRPPRMDSSRYRHKGPFRCGLCPQDNSFAITVNHMLQELLEI